MKFRMSWDYVYGILQFKVPNIKGIVMEEK